MNFAKAFASLAEQIKEFGVDFQIDSDGEPATITLTAGDNTNHYRTAVALCRAFSEKIGPGCEVVSNVPADLAGEFSSETHTMKIPKAQQRSGQDILDSVLQTITSNSAKGFELQQQLLSQSNLTEPFFSFSGGNDLLLGIKVNFESRALVPASFEKLASKHPKIASISEDGVVTLVTTTPMQMALQLLSEEQTLANKFQRTHDESSRA